MQSMRVLRAAPDSERQLKKSYSQHDQPIQSLPKLNRKNPLSNKIEQFDYINNTFFIPTYIRGELNELVSVFPQNQQISARFSIYFTIPDFRFEEFLQKSNVQNKQINKVEYLKLRNFINNNFTIQCGDQHIDIINYAQDFKEKSTSESNSQDSQDNSDSQDSQDNQDQTQAFNQKYIYKRVTDLHSQKYITYMVEGIFKCDYTLSNIFFPYHTIDSSLSVTVQTQYVDKYIIRYNTMYCDIKEKQFPVFNLKFKEERHCKFGIYILNKCDIDVEWQQKNNQDKGEQLEGVHQQQDEDQYINQQPEIKSIKFIFQLYSFNLPFILRYQIPVWTLCFASIMLYFAAADSLGNVYGNIILLSISFISLISNFRQGQFDTQTISFYQLTIFGFIVINFLLIIISTENFYSQDNSINDLNAHNSFFIAAISIAGTLLTLNIGSLCFFGFRTKRLEPIVSKSIDDFLFQWNQDVFINQYEPFKSQTEASASQANNMMFGAL